MVGNRTGAGVKNLAVGKSPVAEVAARNREGKNLVAVVAVAKSRAVVAVKDPVAAAGKGRVAVGKNPAVAAEIGSSRQSRYGQ